MCSFRMRTLCKVHQYWAWFYRKKCSIVVNGIPKLNDNYVSTGCFRKMCSCSCVNVDSDFNFKNELLKPYVRSLLKEYKESLLKGQDALKLITDVGKIKKIVDLIQSFKVVESNIHSLQEMKRGKYFQSILLSKNDHVSTYRFLFFFLFLIVIKSLVEGVNLNSNIHNQQDKKYKNICDIFLL